jgi:hypothetical protein
MAPPVSHTSELYDLMIRLRLLETIWVELVVGWFQVLSGQTTNISVRIAGVAVEI